MVSKVVVIALVAVIAVPILLGYALNLEEVTETDYKTTGEVVNVTPLLKSGTGYSYAAADTYQLNSNFYYGGDGIFTAPVYNNISPVKTSVSYVQYIFPEWAGGHAGISDSTIQYDITIDYNNTSGYVNGLFDDDGTTFTVYRIQSFHYDQSTEMLYYTYYADSSATVLSVGTHQFTNLTGIDYIFNDGLISAPLVFGYTDSNQPSYVDISSGYYFEGVQNSWSIGLTQYTKEAILTIDLDSITDANYSVKIGAGGHASGTNFNPTEPYILTKTTTAGVVTWTLTDRYNTRSWDLYYDPEIPHNTYQFYCDYIYDHSGEPYYSGGYYWNDQYYNSHREFRYVGNWSDTIGEANVYWKMTDDVVISYPMLVQLPDNVDPHYTDYNFTRFYIGEITSDSQNRTPTLRADAATFRAFEYPTIENKTYDPSTFKTNPSTTIKDTVVYGSSFVFGGNTYNVTKGNITLGSHQIPVNGLVLSSVPNVNGGYDNKIGNTIVSTTLYPSSITFNGKWSASISTVAQESYTYTKTEWKAGEFAWDGIDHNFLLVGLITCLGVFIGCGIYARRSRSGGIIPLMIITGCAAFVFFIML